MSLCFRDPDPDSGVINHTPVDKNRFNCTVDLFLRFSRGFL